MISLTSPVRTRAHDWPAGAKLAGLSLATVALFFLREPAVQVLILAGVLTLYCLPGAVFREAGLRRLRVLWPFVVIVLVWHGLTDRLGDGIAVAARLLSAVALANLVTMTTRLTDMIGVLTWLLTPLRAVGLRTRAVEVAIGLVIRLTPVLLARAGALREAWRARATRRPDWRIVLPFALSALDDADRVGEALKARGGLGTDGKG